VRTNQNANAPNNQLSRQALKAQEQGKKLIAKQKPENKSGRPVIDLDDDDSDDSITPATR